VFACFSPPPEQGTPVTNLILRTRNILLAKVVSATDFDPEYKTVYEFEILESLKGTVETNFTIIGHPYDPRQDERFKDYTYHTDEKFWNSSTGRSWNDEDCEIHPKFENGITYLIFLDQPYHRKSFEIITDIKSDKWLHHVRNNIEHTPEQKTIEQLHSFEPTPEDIALSNELIGTWVQTNSPKVIMHFDYKKDGKYVTNFEYIPDSKLSFEYGGNWKVKDGHLIETMTYGSGNCLIKPYASAVKIMELTESVYTYHIKGKYDCTAQRKTNPNQRFDPTVKTPVESGKVQGTAGHP
jgi:hypothetical protein